MSAWTKERPTEPGNYWMRDRTLHRRSYSERVSIQSLYMSAGNGLCTVVDDPMGTTRTVPVSELSGMEWQPVEGPKP